MPMPQMMTPEEALDLLDRVTGEVQANRAGHTAIIQAMRTLRVMNTELTSLKALQPEPQPATPPPGDSSR